MSTSGVTGLLLAAAECQPTPADGFETVQAGSSADAEDRLDRGAGLGVGGRLVDLVEVVELHQAVEREPALHVQVEQLGTNTSGTLSPSTTPIIVLQLCMNALAPRSILASGLEAPRTAASPAGGASTAWPISAGGRWCLGRSRRPRR